MRVAKELAVQKHRHIRAFTLPEVLISILMSAAMITALYGTMVYGFSNVKLERENLRATQILVEQLEGLRLKPYTTLRSYTTNAYFDPVDYTNAPGALYSIAVTTSTLKGSDLVAPGTSNPVVWYTNAIMRITATATWTNSNVQKSCTIQTFASKNGMQQYIYSPK